MRVRSKKKSLSMAAQTDGICYFLQQPAVAVERLAP